VQPEPDKPEDDSAVDPTMPPRDAEGTAAIAQLISEARELLALTSEQYRGVADLAVMEAQLALSSLKWGLCALVMFSASCLLTYTCFLAAGALALLERDVPMAGVLALCGALNAVVAVALFHWLKALAGNLYFTNLRRFLSGADRESFV
jgi:hypothetical protein